MLTISMDVMFGATLSPEGKYKFKSFEAASAVNLKIESSTHFTVYTIMARESGKRPLCDTWTFQVETEDDSATWVSLLRLAIRPKITDDKANALVLINPISGKRKSLKIFETVVKPIFEIGCMSYTLQITNTPGHAAELAENEDLSAYTSIITVSGDGLLHEVLNGLLRRKDWAKYKTLPLGIIPTGTGNGLAKSADCLWPEQASVAVVKGESRLLDIMSATLASGRVEYCFLSMTWGLIADIDIESERMRWAGSARLDLYGTIRLMNLRYYGGRLHYLPAMESEDSENSNEDNIEPRRMAPYDVSTQTNSATSSIVNIIERTNQGADVPWGLPPPNFSSPLIRHSPKPLPSMLPVHVQPAVTLHPTLTAGINLPITKGSLPPRWKTVEGPFAQVIGTNLPWLSAGFLACQRARMSDGVIDLVYSRGVTKWQILPYISASAKDNYMNKDGVEHVKVRAFILEPTGLRTTSRSVHSFESVQSPTKPTSRSRPLSVPVFSSLRTRSLGRPVNVGENVSPKAPVPVRVRSQAYSSYHQQTVGRSSSLLVRGLACPQTDPLASIKPGDAAKENNAQRAAVSGNAAAPRPPVQAVFSVRSETEVASLSMEQQSSASAASSTRGSVVTHSPIPNGLAKNAIVTSASPVTTTAEANGTFVDPGEADADDGCRLVGQHGIIDLDGEVVELGPIKVECLPNLVSVICPPWLNESHLARVGSMPAPNVVEPIKGSLSREGSMLSFANS
ncbi:ATP-NAD kinase-like domain-containing protein [Coemansia spiralis]|nr:ATP-NAD kinase-like domain-containing protein [Coemansia spiralis]